MSDDTLSIDGFGPVPVVAPASTAEVGEVVRRCAAAGQAVYPVGGRTMLDYGMPATRPGVAVDLRRLDRVIDYPARDMTVTVEAGLTVAKLQALLHAEGQHLPIDVPNPERATLGGIVAANVSGPRRYGYGTLRDYVIGIGLVNDRGEETKAGGRVVKNVAGYDLMKLYTGSLGTLGVITQVTLKLKPLPEERGTVAVACHGDRLEAVLNLIHSTLARPVSVEVDGNSEGFRVEVGLESGTETVRWQVKQLGSEFVAAGFTVGDGVSPPQPPPSALTVCRVNIPPSAVAGFVQRAVRATDGTRITAHAANGIVRVLAPCGDDRQRAAAVAGAFLADATEHRGNLVIERCPADWKPHLPVWGRPRGDLALMKAVKRQLDPHNIFNPRPVRNRSTYPRDLMNPTAHAEPSCPPGNPGHGIDYGLFLDCIHCGLCLGACPTYEELGTEMDGPRGRIYLMRAVTDGRLEPDASVRKHLDLCLNCRACETACPSGVQYHKLLEPFREALDRTRPPDAGLPWPQRLVLRHVFPYAGRTRLALAPVRVLQRLGLDRWLTRSGLLKLLPAWARQMHEMLPALAPHYGSLPALLPAEGRRRARVGVLLGCVADGVYPATNYATIRVLQRNGCEVVLPRSQGCCGALAFHGGREHEAQQFAVANCRAFGIDGTGEPLDAIVTNAAGCGAMLKEYDALLKGTPHAELGAKFQSKVCDISEFLMKLGPIPPTHPLPIKATYHDACHLRHAQHIYEQPRQLLALIPGLELVPLPETDLCCGAAGSYNLTQPEMAERLGERKAHNILETGASAVFTGNVGCLMQVTKHLHRRRPGFWVAHPIDALWAAYTGDMPTLS